MLTINTVSRQGLFAVALVFTVSTPALAVDFETIDKNGDNKLQAIEMYDVFGNRAQSFMDRWDQNGSGDLTRREVRQSNKKRSVSRIERRNDENRSADKQTPLKQPVRKTAPVKAEAAEKSIETTVDRKARAAAKAAERKAKRATKAAERKAERAAKAAESKAKRQAERQEKRQAKRAATKAAKAANRAEKQAQRKAERQAKRDRKVAERKADRAATKAASRAKKQAQRKADRAAAKAQRTAERKAKQIAE